MIAIKANKRIVISLILIAISLTFLIVIWNYSSFSSISGAAVGDPCNNPPVDCPGYPCMLIGVPPVSTCMGPCSDSGDCPTGYFCDPGSICQQSPPESDCDNSEDDDNDGDEDCQDEDCDGEIGPDGGTCEYPSEANCGDGKDNDGDGDVDCADSNCNGLPGDGGVCQYSTETTCNDGFDNDGDGDADCADTNCDGKQGSSYPCENPERTAGMCHDTKDNDDDGKTDCCDTSCASVCSNTCTTDAPCGNYKCNTAACVCRTSCTLDSQCITGYTCSSGSCVPGGGSICTDSNCKPYKCQNTTTCYSSCTLTSNCYDSSYTCNTTTSQCQLISSSTTCDDDDCGAYKCNTATNACFTNCTSTSQCYSSGYECSNNMCKLIASNTSTLGTTAECKAKYDSNSHVCQSGEGSIVYQSSILSCCCDTKYIAKTLALLGKKCVQVSEIPLPIGTGGEQENNGNEGTEPNTLTTASEEKPFYKQSYFGLSFFNLLLIAVIISSAVVVFLVVSAMKKSKTMGQYPAQQQIQYSAQYPTQQMIQYPATQQPQQMPFQGQQMQQPTRQMQTPNQQISPQEVALKNYIAMVRARGFNNEQIRQVLLQRGWRPEQFEKYLF